MAEEAKNEFQSFRRNRGGKQKRTKNRRGTFEGRVWQLKNDVDQKSHSEISKGNTKKQVL